MNGQQSRVSGQHERALWEQARARLVAWTARRFHAAAADTEEFVQEGIRQFLEAGGTASGGLAPLLDGVGSRINGIAVNRLRKKSYQAVRLTGSDEVLDPPDDADPEVRLEALALARKAVKLVLQRASGDGLVCEMVIQMTGGLDTPADIAQALGVDVQAVYQGRRRLAGHARAVALMMDAM
jgi:hypothetical protein